MGLKGHTQNEKKLGARSGCGGDLLAYVCTPVPILFRLGTTLQLQFL